APRDQDGGGRHPRARLAALVTSSGATARHPPELPMSKEEILRFQERWMRPAGLVAVLGAVLLLASVGARKVGIPSPGDSADQLLNYQAHAGQLVLSAVLGSLGILSFTAPLYFLFRSALARPLPQQPGDERQPRRMRGFLGAFVIIGPLFVALQGTL